MPHSVLDEGHEEETLQQKQQETQTVELIKHYELGIAKLTHTSLNCEPSQRYIACQLYLRVITKQITIDVCVGINNLKENKLWQTLQSLV